jgi:hypothetical protein
VEGQRREPAARVTTPNVVIRPDLIWETVEVLGVRGEDEFWLGRDGRAASRDFVCDSGGGREGGVARRPVKRACAALASSFQNALLRCLYSRRTIPAPASLTLAPLAAARGRRKQSERDRGRRHPCCRRCRQRPSSRQMRRKRDEQQAHPSNQKKRKATSVLNRQALGHQHSPEADDRCLQAYCEAAGLPVVTVARVVGASRGRRRRGRRRQRRVAVAQEEEEETAEEE